MDENKNIYVVGIGAWGALPGLFIGAIVFAIAVQGASGIL